MPYELIVTIKAEMLTAPCMGARDALEPGVGPILINTLLSGHPRRINLSPFTKDFRGQEDLNESIDLFLRPHSIVG